MALRMDQHPSAPQRVQAALSAAGVAARIEAFPSSTRTAQEAATAVGTSVGQIVKSLVFLAAGAPVLARPCWRSSRAQTGSIPTALPT